MATAGLPAGAVNACGAALEAGWARGGDMGGGGVRGGTAG